MISPTKNPRPFCVGCLFLLVILLGWELPSALADESVVEHMGEKFLRGTANVTTGIGELPKQLYLQLQHDPIMGLPLGLFDGIGMSVVRISAGICDIGTFLLPLPHNDEPLLKPEFVWEPER